MKNVFNLKVCLTLLAALGVALFVGACRTPRERANRNANTNSNANAERSLFNSNDGGDAAGRPTIEVSPVEAGAGGYKVINADTITVTVRAAEAEEVRVLYQPVTASDRFVELKTITEPHDRFSDRFETEFNPPADFNGEVWARVRYASGETKQTERLRLATRDEQGGTDSNRTADGAPANVNANANSSRNNQATNGTRAFGPDESARSDAATGGRVLRAALQEGRGDVRLTLNVPAFLLTLWQGDKEIAAYPVGVGRAEFPIPVGERTASKIILNPAWIPPDSAWVRASPNVEAYERIPASDPRNPLGKIKIPLGDAYLIHEAESPADLGTLVSHGCVRVLREDLFDLLKKIARARSLSISDEEIEAARGTTERRVVELGEPLAVDINYDTAVVEGGVLRLYPDVYKRGTNTVERLREELKNNRIDDARLDDATLKAMLDRVNDERLFAVKLSDLKAGRALERGKTEPLTPQQAEEAKRQANGDSNSAPRNSNR